MQHKKILMIAIDIVMGLPKSVFFNFKYLPPSKAIKLPVIISSACTLLECHGKIRIESEQISFGMIKIGIGTAGVIDRKFNRSVLEFGKDSMTIFKGNAKFGHGTKISSNGTLVFGDNISFTGDSIVYCAEKIEIGDETLVSWNTQLMDTDLHSIFQNGACVNHNRAIIIGKHVWIGSNSSIYKGAVIGDDVVIAAGSNIRKGTITTNVVYGGMQEGILKNGVLWRK